MKTTLDLPDELIRAVKLRAVVQRRTLKDLVADMLRQGLGITAVRQTEAPASGSMVEIGAGGLPVIRCHAGAPAANASVEELLKLEQLSQLEQDLRSARLTV